jgi:hypothetical protein
MGVFPTWSSTNKNKKAPSAHRLPRLQIFQADLIEKFKNHHWFFFCCCSFQLYHFWSNSNGCDSLFRSASTREELNLAWWSRAVLRNRSRNRIILPNKNRIRILALGSGSGSGSCHNPCMKLAREETNQSFNCKNNFTLKRWNRNREKNLEPGTGT